MDSNDLQQPGDEPRRRSSSMALLAAGSLTGLVLGFGGMAFAAEPAPSTGTAVEQTATADEDAAAEDSAQAPDDELCDEPGARDGGDDAADAEASSTSAAA